MHDEENPMAYMEDVGCCSAVLLKLRKRRHMIMIASLLVSAMVFVGVGLYNGLTFKKYSDIAILVGILFPSVILLFICIYLAFICGRESFRSSTLSRIHHLSGGKHYHRNQDISQYPETNPENCDMLQVRFRPRVNNEDPRKEESPSNRMCYTTDDDSEVKKSRKPFRSFSNSDVSRGIRNPDFTYKKPGMREINCRFDDNLNSPIFRRYRDVAQHREFKRSVSDSATKKNRNAKLKEDKFVWNTESLDKLRQRVDGSIPTRDVTEPRDYELSCDERKSPLPNNVAVVQKYANVTRFKECEGNDKKYRRKQEERFNISPKIDIKKKSFNGKSEIRLYSTSVLKHPCEYRQTLQFSSFQPGRENCKEMRDVASCSNGDENNGSFSSYGTLEMEKDSMRSENLSSKDHSLRRETIYFPSTNNRDMARRPAKEYAHEYCNYSNKENKNRRPLRSRNEDNFEDHQSDKQERSNWR